MRLQLSSRRLAACLPGPGLRDTGVEASLAGFGEYFRASCQTDSRGPMKYHYCQVSDDDDDDDDEVSLLSD